jgi:hypothetical protein
VAQVRSVALDAASWAPPLVALFCRIGNAGAPSVWGAGPVVAPEAPPADRAAAIRAKYEQRRHGAPSPARVAVVVAAPSHS